VCPRGLIGEPGSELELLSTMQTARIRQYPLRLSPAFNVEEAEPVNYSTLFRAANWRARGI